MAAEHPGIDPARFATGAAQARTVYGVVVDGVHYRSGCDTRHGAYPSCDVLDIPSYSAAKSAVAALALLWMERLHPGVKDLPVGQFSHARGCMADTWKDTRFVAQPDLS